MVTKLRMSVCVTQKECVCFETVPLQNEVAQFTALKISKNVLPYMLCLIELIF